MNCTFNDAEILTPLEMNEADQLAVIDHGIDSFLLMQNAGQSVSDVVLKNYMHVRSIAVLCGAGNNSGDGYIVAEVLRQNGFHVVCYALSAPKTLSDAEKAFKAWGGITKNLIDFKSADYELIIDGLFGSGLDRPLSSSLIEMIENINKSKIPIIAIDLPSGVSGRTGEVMGAAFQATFSVTFFRFKPGHWLYPGRQLCGKLVLSDIGIPKIVLEKIKPQAALNIPDLWQEEWPKANIFAHKYSKGHVAVFSGPAIMTGASRLSAKAAQRVGAGAVTLLSAKEALSINAQHLTSIMLHQCEDEADSIAFIGDKKVKSVVLGPGFGDMQKAYQYAKAIMTKTKLSGLILDADALTAFQNNAKELALLSSESQVPLVITPHEGEFARLFPNLAQNKELTHFDKALMSAKYINAVVVYKGADTIIAAPDGRSVITINGTPLLATAGSGDVLAGLIAGLVAQNMPIFEAACAAVWLHAECAQNFGAGLIAEDLPDMLPQVLTQLLSEIKSF